MNKYNFKIKACATCEYWTGQREISADQKFVLVKAVNVKGICYGKYKKQEKQANYVQSCWTQWKLLNEKSIVNILKTMQEIINENDN